MHAVMTHTLQLFSEWHNFWPSCSYQGGCGLSCSQAMIQAVDQAQLP